MVSHNRKNPDHLKAFRHPAKAKSGKDSKDKDSKSTTKSTAKSTTQDKDKDKDKDKDAKSKDTKDTKDIKDKDKKDSKAKAKAKAKGKGDSDTDKDSDSGQDPADKMKSIKRTASTLDPSVENYKNVLKICLSKNKVSVDEKRMLRTFRRDHDVSDQDHFRLLLQFGWSADEFEDGLKKDDDCDLDEERKVLENNGFAIISIKKGKTLTKEQDNVFSRVCAKFFQTMSKVWDMNFILSYLIVVFYNINFHQKAQANYTIVEVGVIVNSDLRKKFNLKLAEFKQAGYEDVEWGFHGSTRDSIKVISQTGFLHPDNLNKNKGISWCFPSFSRFNNRASIGKPAAKKGGKKAASKVTVLDDGFFGKGIYFSFYSDYAMFYSEERNSDQVMLSQVATGRISHKLHGTHHI